MHLLFLRSSLLLMGCVLLNKGLGFAEKALIARIFGASPESDAILMTQGLFLTGWLIMEEVLAPALIPVLQYIRKVSTETGRDVAFTGIVLALALPVAGGFVIAPFFFPRLVATMLFPGFTPESKELVFGLWKFFAWGCLPYFLTPILQAYAHSQRMFFVPAVSQVLGRIAMLACMFFGVRYSGLAAVGWAIIACGTLHAGALFVMLRFISNLEVSRWAGVSAYLGRFSYLVVPLLLGLIFSQASHWVDIRLASSLPAGTVSALAYARKLIDMPILLGAFCLGTVLLPYLSDFHVKSEFRFFRTYLIRCGCLCAFGYGLIAALYLNCGELLVRMAFGSNRLGAGSREILESLVRLFAWGLPVFALEILVMQAVFAMRKHWRAILIGMGCASLNIAFTLWLFPKFGIVVIPVALVLQKGIKTCILSAWLIYDLREAARARKRRTAQILVPA